MKITDSTTLLELETERARLGVSSMFSAMATLKTGAIEFEVMVLSADGLVRFTADTLPKAIAGAFELREKQIAERITSYADLARRP